MPWPYVRPGEEPSDRTGRPLRPGPRCRPRPDPARARLRAGPGAPPAALGERPGVGVSESVRLTAEEEAVAVLGVPDQPRAAPRAGGGRREGRHVEPRPVR